MHNLLHHSYCSFNRIIYDNWRFSKILKLDCLHQCWGGRVLIIKFTFFICDEAAEMLQCNLLTSHQLYKHFSFLLVQPPGSKTKSFNISVSFSSIISSCSKFSVTSKILCFHLNVFFLILSLDIRRYFLSSVPRLNFLWLS